MEKEADINNQDKNGKTDLFYACRICNERKILDKLMEKGLNINHQE